MESFFTINKDGCPFPPTRAALNDLIDMYHESWDRDLGTPEFDAGEEYDACDRKTQRELFLQLWKLFEHVDRLPVADRKLNPGVRLELDSEDNVPTPSGVRTSQNTGEPEAGPVVKDEFTEINLSANPHFIKAHFLKHWVNGNYKSADPPSEAGPERSHESSLAVKSWVSWNQWCLYASPEAPGFHYNRGGRFHPLQTGTNSCRVWELISSPLLLYRLMAVFGMPPASEQQEMDNSKQAWQYSLYWTTDRADGKLDRGRLTFCDYKGGPGVKFRGPEEASKSALKLFEWLVGDNVSHTYDNTLAGCAA